MADDGGVDGASGEPSAWRPLEALQAPWEHRPAPRRPEGTRSWEDRQALAERRAACAKAAFLAQQKEDHLNRDGEAVTITPVPGLQVPSGPAPDLAELRLELRSKM
mmetsp:Transcript_64699/g.140963  ORF Transcript_64699/g.140963 Transcript_64699/m.140963 type:complete len:106 (-) Transcript_64699:158-475(-)